MVAAGVEAGMLEVETRSEMLPGIESVADPAMRWFSRNGCVLQDGEERLVFVGGTLVARFDESDAVARRLVLVGLAENKDQHIGRLAQAFGVCDDTVRNLQKRYAEGGAARLVPAPNKPPRAKPRLNRRQKRDVERLFERGKRPFQVIGQVEAKYRARARTPTSYARSTRGSALMPPPIPTDPRDKCATAPRKPAPRRRHRRT